MIRLRLLYASIFSDYARDLTRLPSEAKILRYKEEGERRERERERGRGERERERGRQVLVSASGDAGNDNLRLY